MSDPVGRDQPPLPSPDVTVTLDLLRQAQGGDRLALDRLVRRYEPRVHSIVRMRLGPALRASLESVDILQETFEAAIRDFDHFEVRDHGSFINWLARIAERKLCDADDHLRAQKRDRRREVPLASSDGSTSLGPVLRAAGPSPSEQVSRNEQIELIEACLSEMPEEYRELIILHDYAGASWEAVAEATGRPSAAAARMKYRTALRDLAARVLRRTQGDGHGNGHGQSAKA
jgi:RNA polymerase sigma-70 factor, ECF subfamily